MTFNDLTNYSSDPKIAELR